MNERDEQGPFTETQVKKICEVIQAGFILIAARLDLQRNTTAVNISTEVALKSATDLMGKLRNRSESPITNLPSPWDSSLRTQPLPPQGGQASFGSRWNDRA